MSRLVITLPPAGSEHAGWALVAGDGALIAEGELEAGARPDLPEGQAIEHVVALMPAEDVFVRHLAVPGRNEREAAQAAPFLIEEELAAPLETQHVAIGPRGEDGRAWLFAADRELWARWRNTLSGLGFKPVYTMSDAMLLTGHGGDLTLAERGKVILFQTRAGDLVRQAGLAGEESFSPDADDPICGGIDAGLAAAVLPALGERIRPQRMIVAGAVDPGLAAPGDQPVALKREPAPDLRLTAGRAPQTAFARLPAFFGTALVSGIDWTASLKPWRRAAALLGVAVLGAAGLLIAEGIYYSHRADDFYEASRELYRAEFDERASDPAAQLRVRLRGLGDAPGEQGFLELAAALAEIAAQSETIRIDSLRYSAERGGLSVTATYPDFADFEAFRGAAEARGLVIEEGGARQGETGVTGDFLVRLP